MLIPRKIIGVYPGLERAGWHQGLFRGWWSDVGLSAGLRFIGRTSANWSVCYFSVLVEETKLVLNGLRVCGIVAQFRQQGEPNLPDAKMFSHGLQRFQQQLSPR